MVTQMYTIIDGVRVNSHQYIHTITIDGVLSILAGGGGVTPIITMSVISLCLSLLLNETFCVDFCLNRWHSISRSEEGDMFILVNLSVYAWCV